MSMMASQITGLTIVYSTVHLGADQRKHQGITGLCEGNLLVMSEFPAQGANNMENVSIWQCHHENLHFFSCWCPDTNGKQGISRCDIDLVFLRVSWALIHYKDVILPV